MKDIVEFFIRNSKFTIVLTIGLIVFGLQGFSKMNSESYPSVSFAQSTIVTSYEGASAQDVETKITKPIEDEIRTVSGLKDVRSISQSGLSTIFVRADIDNVKDPKKVMADVQRAIDRASKLPHDLRESPKFTEINSEEFPVLEVAVSGTNKERLRDKVSDLLKEDFEDNKKVKEARLTGYSKRLFKVELDNDLLKKFHIGSDEVLSKIQKRNLNIPGGSLEGSNDQLLVRLEGKIQSSNDLENIVIRSNFTGEEIILKDVAKVIDDEEEHKVRTRVNGKEATLIIVSKKAGADTIELVNEIKGKIESYKKLYGDQLSFEIYNNESSKVENRLNVLASNAISGLLLVVLFLFIFLPGRIGLMASLSLPLAVMGTIGMMPLYDMNLNAITILALVIALGMLVDNSVVISENFTRLRHEGKSNIDAAMESVMSLWLPITATAFTTIAAFLPMLVTKGIMGQFIKFIPILVTISLLISLAESFFFLPMRLVLGSGSMSEKEKEKSESNWFIGVQDKFEKIMKYAISKRYLMTVAFLAVCATSVFLMVGANKFILFPPDQTEVYIARLEMKKGTPLKITHDAMEKLSQDIKSALGEDMKFSLARAGVSQVNPTDPKLKQGDNVGMVTIYVTDHAKDHLVYTEALKKLRAIDTKLYADSVSFEAMINGPPVGNDIEATFRSNSFTDLDKLIGKITNDLSQIDGITDLQVDDIFGDDEIYVDVNHAKADQLGLSVQSIGETIKAAVNGKMISNVTLDNKDIDINVRFKKAYRQNIEDLKRIEIMDRLGNLVPLSTVATFHNQAGSPQIKRFDFKRAKTLTGSVNDSKITAIVANKKLEQLYQKYSVDFPSVSLVFGGVAESTKESMDSLKDALVLSLIGIFALLVFLFRSFLRPAIIMTTIPLGLLGFSIAFFLHQRPISFLALIGIIGLGGIIVNSGIVLISFIDEMRNEGKLELEEILIKASGLRLKAVLVTSLTTISGLIPTAYGIGGTDAMLIPMTLAMAWGLTSGTILTLIWVPCAYAILEDFSHFTKKLLSSKAIEKHETITMSKEVNEVN